MPTFETQGGTSPGVTILATDGTVHTTHTTAGFTEAVAGSGVYNYPHPSPGTLLEFVFDATVGGTAYYASVWDDGLSTVILDVNQPYYAPTKLLDLAPIQAKTDNLPVSPAATGDAMTLTETERTSIASAVWVSTTRTLTSFGTLVSDIATAVWSSAMRTLTDFGFTPTPSNAADTASIKAKTDNLPTNPAAVGSEMTLVLEYDAAKTAATQTSVNAIPTNPLLADNYVVPPTVSETTDAIRNEFGQELSSLGNLKTTGHVIIGQGVGSIKFTNSVDFGIFRQKQGYIIKTYAIMNNIVNFNDIVAMDTTDINGEFDLWLDPGLYILRVEKNGAAVDTVEIEVV